MTPVHFKITGMSCAGCAGRAQRALDAVEGLRAANVNLVTETATVHARDRNGLAQAFEALSAAGYPAQEQSVVLDLSGLSCASCVARAEGALREVPGVIDASVNLASEQGFVRFVPGIANAAQIAARVTAAGYPASWTDTADVRVADKTAEADALLRDTWRAALLTLPVFVLAMGAHFIPAVDRVIDQTIGQMGSWWIQAILTTLVLVGPGRRFFDKGVPALLRGAPEMNALVVLGTSAAWAYSTLVLLAPGVFPDGARAVYYEAAAVIATLILLGRTLEARAKGRTGAAIERLVGLQPATARVLRDGQVQDMPIAAIVLGDHVQVRPGERLPVDGTVLEGQSYVDESMISGEPVPLAKAPGATVIGGTVNGTGALEVRAEAVGRDTMLARIIQMVQDAQGAKLPIQALVDRVTAIFVPIVLVLALVTVAVWLLFGPDPALSLALVSGVSILIVACPCAMGLATPTSIMVGTGRAADLGVLFRRGDALQTLDGTAVVAFDKTGTLTEGRPSLTTFEVAQGQEADAVLAVLAAVEGRSEHPIARAVMRAAAHMDLPKVDSFEAVTGMGVCAVVGGTEVLIGADRFLAAEGVALKAFAATGARIADAGATPLYAAFDGQAVAVIGVSDPIKTETPEAVAALHAMGMKVAMITGDNRKTAQFVADTLGIDDVVAEVLPDGKVAALKALRERYGPVAFVGDGTNDAPALAEADTGIAIGTGTDVAIEAADVVLMSGALGGVLNALRLSRATLRNIRQNLFWAFAYNVALIPVAAGVLYPLTGMLLSPMLAGGAMALSSVFVVSNALRLNRVAPATQATPHPGVPLTQLKEEAA